MSLEQREGIQFAICLNHFTDFKLIALEVVLNIFMVVNVLLVYTKYNKINVILIFFDSAV